MARRYSWLVLVGLVLVGIFVVMRVLRSGGGVPPVGQDSPQAVLRKLQRALADSDKAKFLECFAARSREHRAAIEALFDQVKAAYALRDALRGTYGKLAWEQFKGALANPEPVVAFAWPRGEDVAAEAKVTIQGNGASVELASSAEPLTLKQEGVWRIEAVPPDADARAERARVARRAEALRKARDEVGKPGVTPGTLARQVEAP